MFLKPISLLLPAYLFLDIAASNSFETITTPEPRQGAGPLIPRTTSVIPTAARLATSESSLVPTITATVDLPFGCSRFNSLLNQCISLTPSFTTYAPTDQASCLCYIWTTWRPDIFDDYISSCASALSTEDPREYRTFSSLEGFCSRVGDSSTTPQSSTSRTPDATSTIKPAVATSNVPPGSVSGPPAFSPSIGSVQNLTRPQKIGIAVGLSIAGLLFTSAVWVGCRRKPKAAEEGEGESEAKVPPGSTESGEVIMVEGGIGIIAAPQAGEIKPVVAGVS